MAGKDVTKENMLGGKSNSDGKRSELSQRLLHSKISGRSDKRNNASSRAELARRGSRTSVSNKSNLLEHSSTSKVVEKNVTNGKVQKEHLRRPISQVPLQKQNELQQVSHFKHSNTKELMEKTKMNISRHVMSQHSETYNKSMKIAEHKSSGMSRILSKTKVLDAPSNKHNSSVVEYRNKDVINDKLKEVIVDDAMEDYSTDFEEYESDFEECTEGDSSEIEEQTEAHETSKLSTPIELGTQEQQRTTQKIIIQKSEKEDAHDSGHYELIEARKRAIRVDSATIRLQAAPCSPKLLPTINQKYSEDEKKSSPLSLDEGFEDTRSGDFTKFPSLPQVELIQFYRTKEDKKKFQQSKKVSKPKSRGQQLLEMIKLNTVSFSLLECIPIPYEEFIKSYGSINTRQVFTQTREENSDIEVQTVEISYKNKWTQFPEEIRINDDDNLQERYERKITSFDTLRFNEFVNRAGEIMLSLLEGNKLNTNIFQKQELPFSDAFLKFDINSVTFLVGREVTMLLYPETTNEIVLTIHASADEDIETTNKQDCLMDQCIGCIWNIQEPSTPMKLFYSACSITACCFHSTSHNVVFAGLEDGSISLWDLKEDEIWHPRIFDKATGYDWIVRTPTYTTAGDAEMKQHESKIVALRTLSTTEQNCLEPSKNKFICKFLPVQICSIDENGCLIIWSVFRNLRTCVSDLALAQWGNIKLVKNQSLSLKSGENYINSVDMHIDRIDVNNIYVATGTNEVLHVNRIGCKTKPSIFTKRKIVPCGNITCLEMCPFKEPYFLVGCDDGTIRLHSFNRELPVLQSNSDDLAHKIKAIQWSESKPLIAYVLDDDSNIYTYNIKNNQLHCISNESMKKWGKIICMQLSSWKKKNDIIVQYLAFGTETGTVLVCRLKKDFYNMDKVEFLQEVYEFKEYVEFL